MSTPDTRRWLEDHERRIGALERTGRRTGARLKRLQVETGKQTAMLGRILGGMSLARWAIPLVGGCVTVIAPFVWWLFEQLTTKR